MIIGIAGVSQSGKTTLAQRLEQTLKAQGYSVLVVHQDDYVHDHAAIPRIKEDIDWESPASIDFESYLKKLLSIRKKYDFLIAEGFLNFYSPKICQLFDKPILISISKTTFLQRKKTDLRWGKVPNWYMEHIWNCYEHYGKIHYNNKSILQLSGEKNIVVNNVLRFLFNPITDSQN